MPPKGSTKPEPTDQRLKVGLTAGMKNSIDERAAAAGMTTSDYVRQLIAIDLGAARATAKPRAARNTLLLLGEVHQLAMLIKRIGVNVNQMARQANTGMVPLTHSELAVMQAQIVAAMEQALLLFERVRKG